MYVDINDFLASRAVAIATVSRNPSAFSHRLMLSFLAKGYRVYPVNDRVSALGGLDAHASIALLPPDVEAIYIIKQPEEALRMAQQAAERGIKRIWIHLRCNSEEAKQLAQTHGISIISGQCFYMWSKPVRGIHWVHRFFYDLFHSHQS